MTTTEARHIGKCPKCRKVTVTTGRKGYALLGTCACGRMIRLDLIVGSYRENVKCGALCRNARGPSCDCECGGANHGINH